MVAHLHYVTSWTSISIQLTIQLPIHSLSTFQLSISATLPYLSEGDHELRYLLGLWGQFRLDSN